MDCIKCGRQAKEGQVFCPDCLEVMRLYPVKKDAVVQIPNREAKHPERQAPMRDSSSQETIRRQRTVIRVLSGVVIFLAILLLVTAGLLLYTLQAP